MKDIAIYGAGGFGKEVALIIERTNYHKPTWNLIGYFDDNPNLKGKMISHFGPCLGGIEELNSYPTPVGVMLAFGDCHVVKAVVEKIHNENVFFPNLIDVAYYIADPPTFHIGKGNIIQGPGTASCDVTIGDFNILNGDVVVGHDVVIGSYNTIMPGVRISGQVSVGDGNFFGINAIILQQLKVGNNVRLGAGSVLMTKPRDGHLYLGNPARKTEF